MMSTGNDRNGLTRIQEKLSPHAWDGLRLALILVAMLLGLLWLRYGPQSLNLLAGPLFFSLLALILWVDVWRYGPEKRSSRVRRACIATIVAFVTLTLLS
jgi:hypothetical protein